MKLKTIKDIEDHEESYYSMKEKRHIGLLDKDKIKEEAIKWAKKHQKIMDETTLEDQADMCLGAINFIEEFFNISEEDLK